MLIFPRLSQIFKHFLTYGRVEDNIIEKNYCIEKLGNTKIIRKASYLLLYLPETFIKKIN